MSCSPRTVNPPQFHGSAHLHREEDTVHALTEEQMPTQGEPKKPTKERSGDCLVYIKASD